MKPLNGLTGCNASAWYVPPATDWFALVERGVCQFEEKARTAAVYGARGMIMYEKSSAVDSPTLMGYVPGEAGR